MKYQSHEVGILQFTPFIAPILSNPVTGIQKFMERYTDFVRVFLWKGQELRFLNHPDFYRQILLEEPDSFIRSKSIFALKPFLGGGLFMAEGQPWKEQRLRLKPAFHGKLIRTYDSIIQEEISKAIQKWADNGMKQFPLELEMQFLTLRIMLKTLLHSKASTDEIKMVHSLRQILFTSGVIGQELSYIDRISRQYLKTPLPTHRKSDEALAWVHGETRKIIALAREDQAGTGLFMQLLLDAVEANEIPEALIYEEVNNLLFAGFDTTAANITWALHELSFSEKWQNIAREEAYSSTTDSTERVMRLPQTRNILQESLRLYPPAWGITRTVEKESMLGGQIHLPRGAHLLLSPYALHRRKDYWEQPTSFIPSRFEQPLPHPFAFLPFGHGQRICIGQQLSKIQSAWILSNFLKAFKIHPPKQRLPRFTGGIILSNRSSYLYDIERVGDPISDQKTQASHHYFKQ